MSVNPILRRIAASDVTYHARGPVQCIRSRTRYFGHLVLRGGTATLLERMALDDRPLRCAPLPMPIHFLRTAPGFVCPGCGSGGGGLFVPAGDRHDADLLHSCLPTTRDGRCACGIYLSTRYVDCPPRALTVRAELIGAPDEGRIATPAPPGLAVRAQRGGSETVK